MSVWLEPLVTGALRIELYGDERLAQQYVHQARRLLGAVRSQHGVDQRIGQGEPGGFYYGETMLPDGTRIVALTNDGQDTVRIWAGASTGGAARQQRPTASFSPYLWIGARIVAGDREAEGDFSNRLHLCVFEQQAAGVRDAVLSNRNHFGYSDPGEDGYPLRPVPHSTPADAPLVQGFGYLDSGLVQISRVQPDGQAIPMLCPQDDPDDPATVTWDEMVVGDPDNELGLLDADGNHLTCDATGSYLVKVMAIGNDCDVMGPCTVELRIVVGKGGVVLDEVHQFTIEQFTTYHMGILPFGWFEPFLTHTDSCTTCSESSPDYGANPHAPHWWQGGAAITVPARQTEVPADQLQRPGVAIQDELLLPDAGFEPAGWFDRLDLCPACETLMTVYGSTSWTPASGHNSKFEPPCPGNPVDYSQAWMGFFDGHPTLGSAPLVTVFGLPTSTTARSANGLLSGAASILPGDGSATVLWEGEWVAVTEPGTCIGGVYFHGSSIAAAPDYLFSPYSGLIAYYKYSRVIDQHGHVVPGSQRAAWISQEEFDAIPYPLNADGTPNTAPVLDPTDQGGGGGGAKATTVCTRVEQD